MDEAPPDLNSTSQRRLAAIVAADIAGYSHLTGVDEEGTVARVAHQLTHVAHPIVKQHRGRIFKTVGDGFLAIFDSSLDAVRCAVAFQESIATQDVDLPDARRLKYRIGVNSGDVIATMDDYYGDSINIAARLQARAEPGGICISGIVYHQVKNKLACSFDSLGQEKFKNIADRVPVYQVRTDSSRASKRGPLKSLLSRTSVAVALIAVIGAASWMAWSNGWGVLGFRLMLDPGATPAAGPPAPTDSAVSRRDAIFKHMVSSMQANRFTWRTVDRLAVEAGVTEAEAHEILASHSGEVVLGKSRDGKIIARLPEQ